MFSVLRFLNNGTSEGIYQGFIDLVYQSSIACAQFAYSILENLSHSLSVILVDVKGPFKTVFKSVLLSWEED